MSGTGQVGICLVLQTRQDPVMAKTVVPWHEIELGFPFGLGYIYYY